MMTTSAALALGRSKTVSRAAALLRFPLQGRHEPSLRARVAAAFRNVGKGVDAGTAYQRTKDFYRSSGASWTRYLD